MEVSPNGPLVLCTWLALCVLLRGAWANQAQCLLCLASPDLDLACSHWATLHRVSRTLVRTRGELCLPMGECITLA
eukprot:796992-Amphidinium_carterae.1